MSQPTIPTDVRERVITAANELYQQSNRERFPTVDAVRRLSRADMNTVSMLMKEWRQAQTTQAVAVAVSVPEAVHQANASALAAMWQQATELANQSLRSAQAGWEAERQDMDDMRAELSGSFEAQAAELESTKGRLTEVLAKLEAEQIHHTSEIARFEKISAELKAQLAAAVERAHTAEARTIEIERRVDDFKATAAAAQDAHKTLAARLDVVATDLATAKATAAAADQTHADQRKAAAAELEAERTRHAAAAARLDAVANELATVKATAAATDQAHADQRKTAAAETQRVADRMIKIDAELNQARKEAAAAREESARLQGHTEAMKTQTADLMRALAAKQEATPAKPVKGAKS